MEITISGGPETLESTKYPPPNPCSEGGGAGDAILVWRGGAGACCHLAVTAKLAAGYPRQARGKLAADSRQTRGRLAAELAAHSRQTRGRLAANLMGNVRQNL